MALMKSAMKINKRESMRFEKAFPVVMRSDAFGESVVVARNISSGGILLEVDEPLPLGTRVKIVFSMPDSHATIVALGEVKNHYHLHFGQQRQPRALTGMGVRFTGFEDPLASIGALVPRRRDAVGH